MTGTHSTAVIRSHRTTSLPTRWARYRRPPATYDAYAVPCYCEVRDGVERCEVVEMERSLNNVLRGLAKLEVAVR